MPDEIMVKMDSDKVSTESGVLYTQKSRPNQGVVRFSNSKHVKVGERVLMDTTRLTQEIEIEGETLLRAHDQYVMAVIEG